MKEKKHRVEDALQASTRGARGGHRPRRRCRTPERDQSIKLDGFDGPDERTGAQIIVRALEEPVRQLAYNAGLEGSVVVDKVRRRQGPRAERRDRGGRRPGQGRDHRPDHGPRSALQNAASIAKNILMTEAVVAEPA